MKAGYMTPAQFTESYCPDYEEKKRKLNVLKSKVNTPKYSLERGEICRQKKNLAASMFTEALEAYTAKVCEEQRHECAESWHSAIAEKGEPYYESIASAIYNAPTPEPFENE